MFKLFSLIFVNCFQSISLIVVEQVNKPDTAILVADLGNLTVKSQLTPKVAEKHTYVEVFYRHVFYAHS